MFSLPSPLSPSTHRDWGRCSPCPPPCLRSLTGTGGGVLLALPPASVHSPGLGAVFSLPSPLPPFTHRDWGRCSPCPPPHCLRSLTGTGGGVLLALPPASVHSPGLGAVFSLPSPLPPSTHQDWGRCSPCPPPCLPPLTGTGGGVLLALPPASLHSPGLGAVFSLPSPLPPFTHRDWGRCSPCPPPCLRSLTGTGGGVLLALLPRPVLHHLAVVQLQPVNDGQEVVQTDVPQVRHLHLSLRLRLTVLTLIPGHSTVSGVV